MNTESMKSEETMKKKKKKKLNVSGNRDKKSSNNVFLGCELEKNYRKILIVMTDLQERACTCKVAE